MKIIDTVLDWLIERLTNYKFKRRIKELRKRDPFIY
jgi:hypothetical protein